MNGVITYIEALATIAFALSGLLAAARKRLDAVGVVVVAGLAAEKEGRRHHQLPLAVVAGQAALTLCAVLQQPCWA